MLIYAYQINVIFVVVKMAVQVSRFQLVLLYYRVAGYFRGTKFLL